MHLAKVRKCGPVTEGLGALGMYIYQEAVSDNSPQTELCAKYIIDGNLFKKIVFSQTLEKGELVMRKIIHTMCSLVLIRTC